MGRLEEKRLWIRLVCVALAWRIYNHVFPASRGH